VRNWLTIFMDSLSPDDPSPIAGPRRAAVNPGFYMPRIPGVPKMDLRFEAVYTNTPPAIPATSADSTFIGSFSTTTCTRIGKTSSETGSEGMAKGFSLGASIGLVHEHS